MTSKGMRVSYKASRVRPLVTASGLHCLWLCSPCGETHRVTWNQSPFYCVCTSSRCTEKQAQGARGRLLPVRTDTLVHFRESAGGALSVHFTVGSSCFFYLVLAHHSRGGFVPSAGMEIRSTDWYPCSAPRSIQFVTQMPSLPYLLTLTLDG